MLTPIQTCRPWLPASMPLHRLSSRSRKLPSPFCVGKSQAARRRKNLSRARISILRPSVITTSRNTGDAAEIREAQVRKQIARMHGWALALIPYSKPRWSGYLACKAEIRSSNSGRLRKLARHGSFRK